MTDLRGPYVMQEPIPCTDCGDPENPWWMDEEMRCMNCSPNCPECSGVGMVNDDDCDECSGTGRKV